MSPTVVAPATGGRGTGNVASTQIRIDMAQRVLELEPKATPLLVLSKKADSRSCFNPKFEWHEDQLEVRLDRVDTTVTTGTSINVDNGPYFGTDDLVLNSRSGELIRVVSVSSNTLTVVRNVDGGGAIATADNDELIIVGSAYIEGGTSNRARSLNPTGVFNYTQIQRDPVEATETYSATENTHTPADPVRQRRRKGIEHAKSIELACLFGKRSIDSSGTHPRRTTGGAYYFIANNNKTDAGGAFTEAEFFAALRPIFRYGSDSKLGVASALIIDVLNGFPRGKLEVQQHESPDTFGLNVTRYRSPHGTLNVVTHWLLEGDKYANEMLVVDLANIAYRYLGGNGKSRDTALLQNRQAPDADSQKDEYLTEFGFEWGLPATHGTVVNVTS